MVIVYTNRLPLVFFVAVNVVGSFTEMGYISSGVRLNFFNFPILAATKGGNMTAEEKLKELTRLWCKWNKHEMTGDEVCLAIGILYHKETLETWNDPLEKLVV